MIPDNIAPGITRTHKGLQDDNLAIHGVVSLVLGVSGRRPRGSRTHWRDDISWLVWESLRKTCRVVSREREVWTSLLRLYK